MTRDEILREIELVLNEIMTKRDNYDVALRLYKLLESKGVLK